ncbi:cadherin-related family member 3-like [Leucoraja erinacea]|uniref:cadherin-related family member 3-like n=1 Tax=Leucoraja erinaceus TaxID=7782 RepID=UPI002453CDFF|nr:cadherin-related family member 3-like [Leucoraja erinacea]
MVTVADSLKLFLIVNCYTGEIPGVRGFIKILHLPATVKIKEDTPAGTTIFNFSVNSTIDGVGLTAKIANSNPVDNLFAVSVVIGLRLMVTVVQDPGLDYETQSNYVLLIYVEDDKGNTDFQTLTVLLDDVNEPPRFLDNLANGVVYVDFLENLAVGALIYEVKATDPDKGDDVLSYSVNSSLVIINPSGKNGAILAAKSFDYEKDLHSLKASIIKLFVILPSVLYQNLFDDLLVKLQGCFAMLEAQCNSRFAVLMTISVVALYYDSFSVIVTVKDTLGHSITGIIVVNLINANDNWPVFKQNETRFNILEEMQPNSVIGKVTAYDLDDDKTSSSLIYFMSSPNQYFAINSVTGELIVSAIMDRDNGPFRDVPIQEFEVGAKDHPSQGHVALMTIIVNIRDINDNQPFCFPHSYSIQVPETTEKDTTIVTISCKDNDVDLANRQFTTSLQPGLGTGGKFALNGKNSTTIVVTGDLDFEAVTNLEDDNVYMMSVVVTDVAPPHYQDTVTVYITVTPVNEFPPTFGQASYTFNISEFSGTGTIVGQVFADDKDFPRLKLIYSLVAGGSTLGYNQMFWINPTSGDLHLVARANYEATAQYLLTVQAVDADPEDQKAATVTVTVNILPTNDEPPDCQPKYYSLAILGDTPVGTNVQGFQLSCTDLDSPPQSFRYFITSGNINNHFRLSPNVGSNITKLILALPFDYTHGVDKVTEYNLVVQITDDNLFAGSADRKVVQTGSVMINVRIIIPTPSTPETTTTPNITYIRLSQNTYDADAWYIPFVITLGCILLLGLLTYLAYHLVQYIRSLPKSSKIMKKPLVDEQESKMRKQHSVIVEMIKRNAIFNGEAVDPVTGNVYQYNTNSGARRWKDTKLPMKDYGNAGDETLIVKPNVIKTNETTHTAQGNVKEGHEGKNTLPNMPSDQPSAKPPPKLGKQVKVAPQIPAPSQTENSLAHI